MCGGNSTHSEQRRTLVTKHFNVVDPLLPHNNLGRSVSQSNLIRIRRAFSHGASKLRKALRQVGSGWDGITRNLGLL